MSAAPVLPPTLLLPSLRREETDARDAAAEVFAEPFIDDGADAAVEALIDAVADVRFDARRSSSTRLKLSSTLPSLTLLTLPLS